MKKLHQELTDGNDTEDPTIATNIIDKAALSSIKDLKQETETEIKIKYKNSTRGKILPPDLEQLGKSLCQGTFQEIASAAFNYYIESYCYNLSCVTRDVLILLVIIIIIVIHRYYLINEYSYYNYS